MVVITHERIIPRVYEVGSQYVCNVKIFINSQFWGTRHKNATQRNARTGSESILLFCWVAVSTNMSATQCNAGP